MSARKNGRRLRGHLLLEAMVGGVVLLLAAGGLSSAMLASNESIALASLDQQADHAAVERIEWLRAQPASSTAWSEGTTTGAVPGHADWTWTITVTPILDTKVGGPVAVLAYRRAQVSIEYRDRQVVLETYRW